MQVAGLPGPHKHPSETLGHLPSICWHYAEARGGLEEYVLKTVGAVAARTLSNCVERGTQPVASLLCQNGILECSS